ncbi:MAG: hypothetical protein ACYDBV_15445 [Nitrospiria bacterium]
MIITDEMAQKAFDYLRSTETEHAQSTADFDALKKHENALIATLKLKSREQSNAAKETEAYASEEYKTWEAGMKEANYNLTLLENKRDRAHTTIDLWRTIQASSRRSI